MIEKVIFDMDGLIFDSERIFMRELSEVIKPYGYKLSRKEYIQTLGLAGKDLTDKVQSIFGKDYPYAELSRRARERVNTLALSGRLPVKDGITDLLEFLKTNNTPCAVASSTYREYVKLYLDAAGLSEFFGTIICGDDVSRSKPNPDIFIHSLGDTQPQNALVLEDSENGIKAAAAAHIPVICIPDMVYPAKEAASLTAAILNSAADVIEFIKSVNA